MNSRARISDRPTKSTSSHEKVSSLPSISLKNKYGIFPDVLCYFHLRERRSYNPCATFLTF